MSKHVARLVKFGRGMDTVYYTGGMRASGYGNSGSPHAAKGVPAGVVAVDLTPALETVEGFKWVFRGPMVNVDLPEGEVNRLGRVKDSPMVNALKQGNYGNLIRMHEEQEARGERSGLDEVSLEEWVEGWRQLGARVGRYNEVGEIDWES